MVSHQAGGGDGWPVRRTETGRDPGGPGSGPLSPTRRGGGERGRGRAQVGDNKSTLGMDRAYGRWASGGEAGIVARPHRPLSRRGRSAGRQTPIAAATRASTTPVAPSPQRRRSLRRILRLNIGCSLPASPQSSTGGGKGPAAGRSPTSSRQGRRDDRHDHQNHRRYLFLVKILNSHGRRTFKVKIETCVEPHECRGPRHTQLPICSAWWPLWTVNASTCPRGGGGRAAGTAAERRARTAHRTVSPARAAPPSR